MINIIIAIVVVIGILLLVPFLIVLYKKYLTILDDRYDILGIREHREAENIIINDLNKAALNMFSKMRRMGFIIETNKIITPPYKGVKYEFPIHED